MDPHRACLLRETHDQRLALLAARHHQVGQLVDHDQDVRTGQVAGANELRVQLEQRTSAEP
jgi:hypothetical protein